MDLSAHLQELDNLIAREKAKGGTLIPVLHQAQELYGFLPKECRITLSVDWVSPRAPSTGWSHFFPFLLGPIPFELNYKR